VRRLVVVISGLALATSACGGSGQGAPRTMTGTISIANLQPFSGADADFGTLMYAGCYAAVQLINRAGGALGHSLDCVKVDTKSAAESGELARSMLASTPNLVAVLGPGSNEAPSTVPLINQARVPMFTDAGQAAFDRSNYAYLWRMTPADDAAGYAMAIWAYQQGYRRGAAIFGADASSQANVPTLLKGFKQLGGSMVVNESLEMGKASYAAEVDAVVQAHPDVIFTEVDGKTAAIFFAELLKRQGPIPIIGTNVTLEPAWLDAVSQSIGPAIFAKSFIAVQPYAAPQGRAWEIFNDALLTSSTEIPNPGQWSDNPYVMSDFDAVTIAALAMVAAGTVDPAIFNPYVKRVTAGGATSVVVHSYAEGLSALRTGHAIQYIGPSGPMAFDQWQNAPIGFSLAAYDLSGQTTLIDSIAASAIGVLSR
jgi:ABC-type branched-subunit amino acid transport system substrate-binding protein